MTGEKRSGSKGMSNSLFSQKDHGEHKSYPRLIQHEFLIITYPWGDWHTHIFLVMREGFYTLPKTEVLIILQHHNNDKHDICLLVVGKKHMQTQTGFQLEETQIGIFTYNAQVHSPFQGLFPFLLQWVSPFLEVLYTPGIFSNRSAAQCVKCLWPSSPFPPLFRGHREEG